MKTESRASWQMKEAIHIGEPDKKILERLDHLHSVEGHFLTKGVFFDVYDLKGEAVDDLELIFKDFRSGDVAMSREEQIALFQHQYYEWCLLRKVLGEQFFPASSWVRSDAFSDDQAHAAYAVPGKTANTMSHFVKIQADRQLADRYSKDDHKKGLAKHLMSRIGNVIRDQHQHQPFIGGIVQEKIAGIPLAEALKRLQANGQMAQQVFRNNARTLIQGLRLYHEMNPYGAFTWHGLESDNVMAEIDEQGMLTGRIQIIDANFTERPNKMFKKAVTSKLEKNVFQRLEASLALL